jgi:hypothetical protein
MTELNLVTPDFINQLLYHTAVHEALIGIDPKDSVLVFEMREFRLYKMGTDYVYGMNALRRVMDMQKLIEANHARVKILIEMLDDEEKDKDQIASYIAELYEESEGAVKIIEGYNSG